MKVKAIAPQVAVAETIAADADAETVEAEAAPVVDAADPAPAPETENKKGGLKKKSIAAPLIPDVSVEVEEFNRAAEVAAAVAAGENATPEKPEAEKSAPEKEVFYTFTWGRNRAAGGRGRDQRREGGADGKPQGRGKRAVNRRGANQAKSRAASRNRGPSRFRRVPQGRKSRLTLTTRLLRP